MSIEREKESKGDLIPRINGLGKDNFNVLLWYKY